MKFKLDENLPTDLAEDLRLAGHEYPTSTHAGVVLFRPGESGPKATLRFIRSRLDEVLSRDLDNRLTVVSRQGIRTR